jgi:hypothetical protein
LLVIAGNSWHPVASFSIPQSLHAFTWSSPHAHLCISPSGDNLLILVLGDVNVLILSILTAPFDR